MGHVGKLAWSRKARLARGSMFLIPALDYRLILAMENHQAPSVSEEMKICPHCQKEIPKKATRCSYCQADLRKWYGRHPILTVLGVMLLLIIFGSAGSGDQPAPSSQAGTTQNTAESLLSQNTPTIKELSTLPTNYIGKSFPLYVYLQTDRYYNYGFNDETAWYSVKIWDSSVDGSFSGVYAYLPKTSQNAGLISKALNAPVLVKVQASVPVSMWQDSSNAFVEVNSWTYQ